MCLYPRLIKNKKYTATKKNGGIVPPMNDERVKYVAVGCGKCIECKKQKSREWQIRLSEELKDKRNENIQRHFITLTFANDAIEELKRWQDRGLDENVVLNNVATRAVRYWLERIRAETGKSVRHWLITERGDRAHTGRIHLHGILWTNKIDKDLNKWQYGWTDKGYKVDNQTINYIIKYITKTNKQYPKFEGKILCSKGIGSRHFREGRNYYNRFGDKTKDYYISEQGYKMALPIYYRNNTYTDDEKERLWIDRLDKKELWVMGEKIDISTDKGLQNYNKMLEYYKKLNVQLGYTQLELTTQDKKLYNERVRKINQKREPNSGCNRR